jgi:stage II sporulation protein D
MLASLRTEALLQETYHHTLRSPWRLIGALVALALVFVTLITSAAQAGVPGSSTLVISGAGDGHGVGMSQEGALGFAQHGWSYQTILAHYYTGTALGQAPAGTHVSVLLAGNRARVSFSGASLAAAHPLNPTAVYTVTVSGHGVQLQGAGARISAPTLSVSGPGPLTLRGTAENGVHNGAYRGTLEISPALHGGLNAVDVLGLEDYVRGTVANEMPASWPAAALAAQAVASRTYAITSKAGPGGEFDLYSDTRSQLYRGIAGESPRSSAAASATAGQIVTYNNRPAITFFFASSGGATESVQNAFGGSPEPWLRGVPDPFDEGPLHNWSASMSFSSAAARLRGLLHGSFQGIEVLRRGYSPRILTAYILGSGGRTTVSGGELAQRLGLYDTWAYFSVRERSGTQPEPDLSASAPAPVLSEPAPTQSTTGQGGTPAQ